jgi:hypothetical protein
MFPTISLDLLTALEAAFPERSPEPGDAHADLMVRAGEARVVRFMRRQYDEQNENVLNIDVMQDVSPLSPRRARP